MFAVYVVVAWQASERKNFMRCVHRCALFPALARDLTQNTYSFPDNISDALVRSIDAEPTSSGVQKIGLQGWLFVC